MEVLQSWLRREMTLHFIAIALGLVTEVSIETPFVPCAVIVPGCLVRATPPFCFGRAWDCESTSFVITCTLFEFAVDTSRRSRSFMVERIERIEPRGTQGGDGCGLSSLETRASRGTLRRDRRDRREERA